MCVCVCHCVSWGAFDPIKTSNLDGWKSLHTSLSLRSFAFLLLPIYIWLPSAVGDFPLRSTVWTEPTLREGHVLTIGFVKFGLRFLHRLARQTIRLRLRLCKSFSLLTWLMFYFKVKQQQTSFPQSEGFWIARHSSLACLAFYMRATKCFQTHLSNSNFILKDFFRFWFDSKLICLRYLFSWAEYIHTHSLFSGKKKHSSLQRLQCNTAQGFIFQQCNTMVTEGYI